MSELELHIGTIKEVENSNNLNLEELCKSICEKLKIKKLKILMKKLFVLKMIHMLLLMINYLKLMIKNMNLVI